MRRVAIITGAATGVGAASALWLARNDYDVLINYRRSAAEADQIVADCQEVGADAYALQGDVADDAACRAAVTAALTRWGRLDALVNSAGTTQFVSMSDLEAIDAADFERVFRVNTLGPFQMARAAAPSLRAQRGAIVNISSIGGVTGNGSSYAYVASKAALNTLTLALARTLAPEVRVNAVLPGFIEGRWLLEGLGEAAYERVRTQWATNAALQTVCTAEQIADVVGWLITNAPILTGQLITADGGMLLGRPPTVGR
jgi:3-oxoacyl-[acyl-carrier protein] reductase